MNIISEVRAKHFSKYKWLCDPLFSQWIVENVSAYGKTILDVGCGNGYMFDYYAKCFEKIAAIDPSSSLLPQIEEKLSQGSITFLSAAAESIPFSDNQYDIVISKSSLHHFEDAAKGLKEMKRVAKNIVAVVEVVAPSEKCMPFLEKIIPQKEVGRTSESIYTIDSLRNLILKNVCPNKLNQTIYDQYIDIDTWIQYSDLSELKKVELYNFIMNIDLETKIAMQLHKRKGRYVMLRRMCLCVAFL